MTVLRQVTLTFFITRPLDASVADWMAAGHGRGGLDLGLGPVTLSWTVAILGFVGYLAVSRKDVQRDMTP